MSRPDYDPEIQAVIDRFIAGEVPLRNKLTRDPAKDKRALPRKSQAGWANSHEEAVEKAAKKKARDGNYYERLANRGLNQKGNDG